MEAREYGATQNSDQPSRQAQRSARPIPRDESHRAKSGINERYRNDVRHYAKQRKQNVGEPSATAADEVVYR